MLGRWQDLRMARRISRVIAGALAATALAGCRLGHSDSPPGHDPLSPGDGFIVGHYRAPSGPVLAVPDDSPDANLAVHTLVDNIRHTPQGASIRIVAYSFSVDAVAKPLIAADQRGVHVQVIVDGRHSHGFEATQALEHALGSARSLGSFIVLTDRSARGVVSHSHQKSWSFSQ